MSELETPIVQRIRLALGGRSDVRIFRNNVGKLEDRHGRWVTFGLCPGSSDLIGWRSVVVTPTMVGRRLALFVALEIKAPGSRTKPEQFEMQQAFQSAVRDAGGIAGEARSVEEAEGIVDGF